MTTGKTVDEIAATVNGTPAEDRSPRLTPSVLRRLNRLHAQAELMQALAQQTQATLQSAAYAACEDAGITIPKGMNLDIDFATGAVTVLPPPPA